MSSSFLNGGFLDVGASVYNVICRKCLPQNYTDFDTHIIKYHYIIYLQQVIQNPILDMSILDLISTIKDRRNSVVIAAQVVVSSVNTVPTDEGESGRSGKQMETGNFMFNQVYL